MRFMAGGGSGECILTLPAVLYTIVFVASRSHALSVETLITCSAVESMAATVIVLRSRRTTSPGAPLGAGPREVVNL